MRCIVSFTALFFMVMPAQGSDAQYEKDQTAHLRVTTANNQQADQIPKPSFINDLRHTYEFDLKYRLVITGDFSKAPEDTSDSVLYKRCCKLKPYFCGSQRIKWIHIIEHDDTRGLGLVICLPETSMAIKAILEELRGKKLGEPSDFRDNLIYSTSPLKAEDFLRAFVTQDVLSGMQAMLIERILNTPFEGKK